MRFRKNALKHLINLYILVEKGQQIVNLNSLVLTNNKISEFSEIDNLSTCKKLEYLSLVDNPIIHKLYYRLYTIYKIPSLRVLDFQKVKKSEREAAKTFFESEVSESSISIGRIDYMNWR